MVFTAPFLCDIFREMKNTIDLGKKYQRVCLSCGYNFYLNPRLGLKWAEKTGKGKFCTTKCAGESKKGTHNSRNTEFKKVSSEQEWRGSARFKTGIWSYSRWKKDKCEECGDDDRLVVHHIDRNRNNNLLNNLVTLCHECHWDKHRGNRVAWNKGLVLAEGKYVKKH